MHCRSALLVLAGFAASPSISAAPQVGPETHSDALPNSTPEITRAEIEHHVRFLASDELRGRFTGTEEAARAARYLAAALRAAGVEPAGDDGTFLQRVPFERVRAKQAPELELAALYGEGPRTYVDIAQETGVKMVNPNFKGLTAEKVKAAHAAGIKVMAWTVDQQADWENVLATGVDGIITNDPEALIAYLKKIGRR